MKKLIVFVTLMMLITMWNESYARPHGGGGSGTPPPVPPHSVPVIPLYTGSATSFVKLSAEYVLEALMSRGLADITDTPVVIGGITGTDLYKRKIQFTYKEVIGHICEFDNEVSFKEEKSNIAKLNKTHKYNNWSYPHNNIILVIDGNLPPDEWSKFKKLLKSL
jgi:hypothetical protein